MSLRPFDPAFLPDGHPDKEDRGTVLGAVWRGLVRYCLRPAYRALVALGSTHVAGLWHPEFGPLCRPPEDGPPSYRASRARLQSGPEAWPDHPTSRGEL
ncbi:hypothetical protein [Streptomyces sp. AC555_RSS877]|uniref:hypothetical protein n=1 Tax=Streptomyces sp. AC555_RSS877 TaxID=2823688 RepID=UPI001C26E870|nr:hypothetical protein [Streptomyces sp. AC555_RSS877]